MQRDRGVDVWLFVLNLKFISFKWNSLVLFLHGKKEINQCQRNSFRMRALFWVEKKQSENKSAFARVVQGFNEKEKKKSDVHFVG